jgi:hypothetical protein
MHVLIRSKRIRLLGANRMLGNEDNMQHTMQGYILNPAMINKPGIISQVDPEVEFTRRTSETMLGILIPQLGAK